MAIPLQALQGSALQILDRSLQCLATFWEERFKPQIFLFSSLSPQWPVERASYQLKVTGSITGLLTMWLSPFITFDPKWPSKLSKLASDSWAIRACLKHAMDHITHPWMHFTGNWSMTSIWMIWHVKSRGILNPHREEKQPSRGLACTVALGPVGQQCCPWPEKQFLSPSPSWHCEAPWGVSQDLHPLGYLAARLFGQKDWISGPTSTSIPSSGVITNWASLCDLHLLRGLTQCLSESWQTFLKRKPGLIFSEADPCLLTFLLTLGKFNPLSYGKGKLLPSFILIPLGFQQPDLVTDVSAHGKGGGLADL